MSQSTEFVIETQRLRKTFGEVLALRSVDLRVPRHSIFGSGMVGWSTENFQALLQYVGSDLVIWSAIALVFGIIYLLWAELEHSGFRKND